MTIQDVWDAFIYVLALAGVGTMIGGVMALVINTIVALFGPKSY